MAKEVPSEKIPTFMNYEPKFILFLLTLSIVYLRNVVYILGNSLPMISFKIGRGDGEVKHEIGSGLNGLLPK
jgi:hypothetical protein